MQSPTHSVMTRPFVALVVFAVVFAVVGLAVPAAGVAQGTLAGQGFGYPAGQLGARAIATGGALAPFDPVSPVNPASVALWPRGVVFFHIQPEHRSTEVAGLQSSTRLSRFPLAGTATHVARNWVAALTFSTYLDRTWETSATNTQTIGDSAVDVTTRYSSSGAVNDVRLAVGWSLAPSLRLGGAYHAYTGQNRLKVAWDFPNAAAFGDVTETSSLSYSGRAVSAGAEWSFATHLGLAAYGRWGGAARMRIGDTLVSEGRMPDHLGVALRYDGIKGTVLAGGWERIDWRALKGLATTPLAIHNSDKLALGIETRGPPVAGTPLLLRAGASRRTLPFDAVASAVRETTLSFGAGFTIAKGAGDLDLALQRASRSAGDARERAWVFTLGLAIRP